MRGTMSPRERSVAAGESYLGSTKRLSGSRRSATGTSRRLAAVDATGSEKSDPFCFDGKMAAVSRKTTLVSWKTTFGPWRTTLVSWKTTFVP
jgi:hypothetical protein